MQLSQKEKFYDAGFIMKAVSVWLITATVLLIVSAAVMDAAELGNGAVGYISSLTTFTAALAAGAAAGRSGKAGIIYTSLVSAAVIVTSLLTLGFLIDGPDLEASGVLSIVSFTFAGCLTGGVLFSGNTRKKQKRKHKKLT